MYSDHQLLSAASALEEAFSGIKELARPEPDFQVLENTESFCRTLGKEIN
jgi:hypothetical protein